MKIKNLAAAAAILILAAALPSGCAAAGRSDPPDADAAETSGLFTERDLAQTAELSEAKTVALSDGETLTIREGGVYLLSGSVKEAQVVVEAGDKDAAFEAAHQLKGVLGNLALTPMYEPVAEMTELLRARADAEYMVFVDKIEAQKKILEDMV